MGLLPAHVSVHYLCAWSRRRLEEGIVSPGMELWMSVGHHVDAGNGTQVCYKSSWCSSAKPSLSPIKSMTFFDNWISIRLSDPRVGGGGSFTLVSFRMPFPCNVG